jgi:hypothetical protein
MTVHGFHQKGEHRFRKRYHQVQPYQNRTFSRVDRLRLLKTHPMMVDARLIKVGLSTTMKERGY